MVGNLVSTSNSNETHFELTWNAWTPSGTEKLEIYNGSDWIDVTVATTALVNGNSNAVTDIRFRTTDGTNHNEKVLKTIEPTEISMNSKTTDSITWALSKWTGYINYTVEGNISGIVASGDTVASNPLVVSSLNPGEKYTLKVRGTDGTNYSLFNTNQVELEAAVINFVDDSKSDSNREIFKDNNSSNGTKNFNIESGVTTFINITAKEEVTFKWELKIYNETDSDWKVVPSSQYTVTPDTGNNSSNFSWRPSETGKFQLNLTMTNDSATPKKEQTLSWEISVTPRSTGSRIWQEGMPTTYTWDARSFSGFYYNLDTGQGDESMTIRNIGRSIDKGDLTYQTTTSETDYEYEPWGTYEIVGFMGDKYFAGDSKSSLMKNGNLSKVLVDTDDTVQLRTGQNYALEEGYSITVQQIDINGGKAQIVFSRDGKEVGSYITNEGETASYYKNIGSGNGNNTTFIKTRVKSVFQGSESAIVEVEGIFQISDNLTRLEDGTKIGKMEITSVTNDRIEMENEERISLSQDSEIDLMGKVKIVVADSGTLRFAPVMEYTEPGVYEIRGTVSDYSESDYIIYEWDPRNFEGFYYDINDDVESSEKIKINQSLDNGSRSIDKGNLEYSSNITTVDYNYSAWGDYSVVGFMGEKYYAGKDGSLLKDGNLSKVLVDTDEKRQMRTGESMILEEGISIKIDQIDTNGNKARLIIEKDGREINSSIVDSGRDYIYEGNNSKIKDTSFIRIRVDSVFQGTESSIVSIGAVFQASLNLTKLDTDTKYGKMKVDSYSSDGIRLSSDEKISLSQDSEAEFMKVGNETMYFKVGDNSTLRFAPVVERTIGSTDPLSVKVSPSTATVGDVVKITLNDRGTTIEGVTVYVNGSKIGTTGSDGTLNYTTDKAGSFRVTGEKSGYVNGTETLTVNEKLINMTVRVSPENIYYGTTGTIKATDSLNGSAVSDATVYVSGENMGRTNSTGELNYTFNKTGTITIEVSKNKYNNGTTSVNISQKVAFAYANFEMKPDEPAAKKAVKVSFDVTNNGIESGSHDVSLVLTDSSGNIIDQDDKTVSVDVGETKSVTLSVKAPEEGSYRLTLKETDSNRTVDLPSSISNVSVGPAKFGSTILYIVLAILAILILAVIGFVAYLFGVKGATKDNYQYVAQEIVDDVKSKFQRK
ncbi:MAG: S-layer protein domain-containing protein [Methanimicrococcus sp.]|nr:S-layer protein domain-containing protein [Methanimicrococcus sp.]